MGPMLMGVPIAVPIGSHELGAIGSIGVPVGAHKGRAGIPAAVHTGSIGVPAAVYTGSIEVPAAVHTGSIEVPAAVHVSIPGLHVVSGVAWVWEDTGRDTEGCKVEWDDTDGPEVLMEVWKVDGSREERTERVSTGCAVRLRFRLFTSPLRLLPLGISKSEMDDKLGAHAPFMLSKNDCRSLLTSAVATT